MSKDPTPTRPSPVTRRDFFKQSSLIAAGTVVAAGFPSILHAQAKLELKAVIIGCPNYEGTCSWQMKRFLDTAAGRL